MTSAQKQKLAVYRMEPELLEGLRLVKERDGLPITWQVRQAIRAWLDSKGVAVRSAPGNAAARPETLTDNLL